MISYKNTGYIPSKIDYRLLDTSILPTTPVQGQYMLDPNSIGGVLMQDQQPACTCFGIVELMKTYFLELTGQVVDFEPAFLYSIALQQANAPVGSGTDPLSVLKIAQTIGCCTKATLNRATTLDLADYCNVSTIPQTAYTEALQYKIPGFLAVPKDIQSIRTALSTNKIVLTARTIGSEWWTPSWSPNDIDPLRTPTGELSGHCTCDIGYVEGDDINVILNHWSTTWGNNGTISYKGSLLTPYISEAFVISQVPQAHLDLVKALPPESEFSHNWTTQLQVGSTGADVQALQVGLMIEGCLSLDPSIQLGTFASLTFAGVKAFQLKYASEILTPAGLTQPTGIVGQYTLKKLNSLFAS